MLCEVGHFIFVGMRNQRCCRVVKYTTSSRVESVFGRSADTLRNGISNLVHMRAFGRVEKHDAHPSPKVRTVLPVSNLFITSDPRVLV